MATKSNGHCENCHIKGRIPTKAIWRVKSSKEELCELCRVECEYDRSECEPIVATAWNAEKAAPEQVATPATAEKPAKGNPKTTADAGAGKWAPILDKCAALALHASTLITIPAGEIDSKYLRNLRSMLANTARTCKFGWSVKQSIPGILRVMKKPEPGANNVKKPEVRPSVNPNTPTFAPSKRLAPAAPVPQAKPRRTNGSGLTFDVWAKDNYTEKFYADRFITDEMQEILDRVDKLRSKQVLVIQPADKDDVKNLRDRVQRTLRRHRKALSVCVMQVVKHNHVSVQLK